MLHINRKDHESGGADAHFYAEYQANLKRSKARNMMTPIFFPGDHTQGGQRMSMEINCQATPPCQLLGFSVSAERLNARYFVVQRSVASET